MQENATPAKAPIIQGDRGNMVSFLIPVKTEVEKAKAVDTLKIAYKILYALEHGGQSTKGS